MGKDGVLVVGNDVHSGLTTVEATAKKRLTRSLIIKSTISGSFLIGSTSAWLIIIAIVKASGLYISHFKLLW
jgi:hypothetical protein